MKIEMGESLLYSWLRHIKSCQIVQTNWKTSHAWTLHNEIELTTMFDELNAHFTASTGAKLFKKTTSLGQLLKQGECDVLGTTVQAGIPSYCAVDVAFHENGLNYGSKQETILKVVAKCIRTAFCLYAYFNTKEGDVIFASPFVSNGIQTEVEKHLNDLNFYFNSKGLSFKVQLICNDEFNKQILDPVLVTCKGAADTSELFARAYKLIDMFVNKKHRSSKVTVSPVAATSPAAGAYTHMKPGIIANSVVRNILQTVSIPAKELAELQDPACCAKVLGLRYALLVDNRTTNRDRYYATPVTIAGKDYYICNDWYENKKHLLIDWIDAH